MYQAFYYRIPEHSVGKVIVETFKTREEAACHCRLCLLNEGYEDAEGNRHRLDWEETGQEGAEKDE